VRPTVRFLDTSLIERILDEARDVLCRLGVTIHNDNVIAMLADHGATVDRSHQKVLFGSDMIDACLRSAPQSFVLYDVQGSQAVNLAGQIVNFTPGSAALNVLDSRSGSIRRPLTNDYIDYVKVVSRLPHIASQSTAMIPADVHEKISDSYRLYLSLMHGEKPVVTGAFTIESFPVMKDLQVAIRGSEAELKAKPLTIFSCCPTSPLKWSRVTSQNVIDCAQYGIPVEFVAMPLAGFMAPVTLVGTLVQHTAETLSGIVISQSASPGTPILYGGSPASFDIRYETTPMGAIETEMIDCAYNEIGKYLNLPTQAYTALSDAKQLDAQCGLETSMGATLAALSGINSISGPGMLDFESCFSLEKLVVDNEICGLTLRMIAGIEPRDDFPSFPRFEELLRDGHLLISSHTRGYLRQEHYFPGPVIDRANRSRWQEDGDLTLLQRAQVEIAEHIGNYEPSRLAADIKQELTRLMTAEARRYGMESLPG